MLWHENESDEFDARLAIGLVEGPGQSLPPGVIRQQRQTPIAGESQLVKMTWLVDMSNLLAMGHGRSRFGTVAANRSRHWQSQWHPDISTHLTPVPPRRWAMEDHASGLWQPTDLGTGKASGTQIFTLILRQCHPAGRNRVVVVGSREHWSGTTSGTQKCSSVPPVRRGSSRFPRR